MQLRCILDGLLLDAEMLPRSRQLRAYDGDEPFDMEAVEAVYYEVVSATPQEMAALSRSRYRLLRFADDFRHAIE